MHRLRTAVTVAAALIIALPALAGCSGSDDAASDSGTQRASETTTESPSSPTEASTSAPADLSRVAGTGYTIAVPQDWEDVIEEARATNRRADIAVAEPEQATTFRMNFNVVQPSRLSPGVTDAALARQAANELRNVTHAKVIRLNGPDFDGSPSIGQGSRATGPGGVRVTLVQYLVRHGGSLYPTTLTFETSREAEAQNIMKGIVDSWGWDSPGP